MASARIRLLLFIALALGGFILKAPLATSRPHLTPDAVMYMNIARNLASGHGYVSTIRLLHVDDAGVTHGALSDCPPLYPLMAAGVLMLGGDAGALSLINMLLVCVASGLVFLIGERLFDWRVGLLAGTAAALGPNLFRAGVTAISDPLALALSLGALSLVLRKKPSMGAWLAAGVLSALATMTRCPYAAVALAMGVYAVSGVGGRRNGAAYAAGILPAVVYVIVAAPTLQTLHYCVESFHETMWNMGSPIDPWFCLHRPGFVAIGLARNTGFYLMDLLVGVRGLFLLGAGLVLWLLQTKRTGMAREQRLAIAVAALNLAAYAATWSIPPVKGSRFMLLSYCLLLPFCGAGLMYAWDRWSRIGKMAVVGVCGSTALAYVFGCTATLSYTPITECRPLPPSKIALVRSSLPADAVVASNNPWELSHSTGLSAALLPRDLDDQALAEFVDRYSIRGIVLLGPCKGSRTAEAAALSFSKAGIGPGIAIHTTTARTHRRAD